MSKAFDNPFLSPIVFEWFCGFTEKIERCYFAFIMVSFPLSYRNHFRLASSNFSSSWIDGSVRLRSLGSRVE